MLLQLIFVTFISCAVSDVSSVVALICPDGLIPYGQAWYASPYQHFIQNGNNKVVTSYDFAYALRDQNRYQYYLSSYKVCLICQSESQNSQKKIEMCATRSTMLEANYLHYQMQTCVLDPNTNYNNLINWCQSNPLRGIFVDLNQHNLFNILYNIKPFFKTKANPKADVYIESESLLMCPDDFTLSGLEIHNIMCNNEVKESVCISCELDDIVTTVCVLQNCNEINRLLDFTVLINKDQSCRMPNSKLISSSDLKTCTISHEKTNSVDSKLCGYKFDIQNDRINFNGQHQLSGFIECKKEQEYLCKEKENCKNSIEIEADNLGQSIGTETIVIIVLSILLFGVTISLILSIWRPWTAKKEADDTIDIYLQNPYYGEEEKNETQHTN